MNNIGNKNNIRYDISIGRNTLRHQYVLCIIHGCTRRTRSCCRTDVLRESTFIRADFVLLGLILR
jgi:hypothetical protein